MHGGFQAVSCTGQMEAAQGDSKTFVMGPHVTEGDDGGGEGTAGDSLVP